MFCKNCGKEINEGTKFCNNCGASQESDAPIAQAVNPAAKNNNTLKIVIIAAVAVVCFIIGAFVIAPSFKEDDTDVSSPVSQSQETTVKEENGTDKTEEKTEEKPLKAIDGGLTTGKAFLSDMGEYGKVSLSVGYNQDNGVIKQVSAAFTITVRHSEYASMKSDFEAYKERFSNSTDKNIEVSYVELSESVSFIIGIKELNAADRADRVALVEEILDFVANEQDTAFYIDDTTTLLVDTYGFEVQD